MTTKKPTKQKLFEGALRILARHEKRDNPQLKTMAIGFVESYIMICCADKPAQHIVDEARKLGYEFNTVTERWVEK